MIPPWGVEIELRTDYKDRKWPGQYATADDFIRSGEGEENAVGGIRSV
jgi:hypothetical protein